MDPNIEKTKTDCVTDYEILYTPYSTNHDKTQKKKTTVNMERNSSTLMYTYEP